MLTPKSWEFGLLSDSPHVPLSKPDPQIAIAEAEQCVHIRLSRSVPEFGRWRLVWIRISAVSSPETTPIQDTEKNTTTIPQASVTSAVAPCHALMHASSRLLPPAGFRQREHARGMGSLPSQLPNRAARAPPRAVHAQRLRLSPLGHPPLRRVHPDVHRRLRPCLFLFRGRVFGCPLDSPWLRCGFGLSGCVLAKFERHPFFSSLGAPRLIAFPLFSVCYFSIEISSSLFPVPKTRSWWLWPPDNMSLVMFGIALPVGLIFRPASSS